MINKLEVVVKTRTRFILALLLLAGVAVLKAQSGPEWAVTFGELNNMDDAGYFSLGFFPAGDMLVSGTYSSSITFGSHTLSTPQAGQDLYVAKKAADGDWLWAACGVGTGTCEASNYVDTSGNCFVYGQFTGSLSLGSQTLINSYPNSRKQAFLAELAANGNWEWAQSLDLDNLNSIYRDNDGNFYILGIDDDPDAPLSEARAIKLDPERNLIWNQLLGTELYTKKIHVDQSGWIDCVTKQQLMKLTPGGTIVQVTPLQGIFMDFKFDADGCRYYRAYASEPITFGDTVFPGGGFLAKLNFNGTWAWVVGDGSTSYGVGGGVAVNNAGGVYISGAFQGTRNFGDITLTNTGGPDLFVAKASSAGEWQWAKQGGGGYSPYNAIFHNGIDADAAGNIYPWGLFRGTASFGSTTLSTPVNTEIDRFLAFIKEPTLTLTSPEPGATWNLGGSQTVAWDHECDWDPKDLDVFLTPFSGPDVPLLDAPADVTSGSASIELPYDVPTGDYDLFINCPNTAVVDAAPITVDHQIPLAPDAVRVEVVGDDVVVSWDPVTHDVNGQTLSPSYYQVSRSDRPHEGFLNHGDPVTVNQFTDPGAAGDYGKKFYLVVAVYNGPPNP